MHTNGRPQSLAVCTHGGHTLSRAGEGASQSQHRPRRRHHYYHHQRSVHLHCRWTHHCLPAQRPGGARRLQRRQCQHLRPRQRRMRPLAPTSLPLCAVHHRQHWRRLGRQRVARPLTLQRCSLLSQPGTRHPGQRFAHPHCHRRHCVHHHVWCSSSAVMQVKRGTEGGSSNEDTRRRQPYTSW
jgi:hypothetical protein